ncbi:MAG: Gfo/Idh/MocA family oxidoreductase [Phycisphaerae bacterium]|nr:Gfo/Idh/MocA family oxidoreductase [Phycisphaerae bacterium]
MDKTIRVGLIGWGGMGKSHAGNFYKGNIAGAELTAVCDIDPSLEQVAREAYGPEVPFFAEAQDLLASDRVDAVVIATPHPSHPPLAIDALQRGLHVMCEKPAGVDVDSVREMNRVAKQSKSVLAMMFQHRLNPMMRKLKELIASGELGPLRRIAWTITDWFRTEQYYQSSSWRAKWKTEGGALLINQCSHTLDSWQWVFGLPKRLRAFCRFGKYHRIETEDEVTAFMEYENDVSAVFISSTGEVPGTNRLEAAGDRGKLVLENGQLTFWRTQNSISEHSRISQQPSNKPECWICNVPVAGENEGHLGMLKDWIQAIQTGVAPIATVAEALAGLQLSNAMLLSTWTDDWVTFPVDGKMFNEHYSRRMKS